MTFFFFLLTWEFRTQSGRVYLITLTYIGQNEFNNPEKFSFEPGHGALQQLKGSPDGRIKDVFSPSSYQC